MSSPHSYYDQRRSKSGLQRCCDRWPWPSVCSMCICLIAVSTFCAFGHLACEDAIEIFSDTAASYTIESILYWVKIAVYCVTSLVVLVALIFLAIGCLATGSVRREYICRFGSRFSGLCQLGTITFICYLLFVIWVVVMAVMVIPSIYFYNIKRNHCGDPGGCIDLRQYGLVNFSEPNKDVYLFCDRDMYCLKNPYTYYFVSLSTAVLVLVMLGHFLMILSANWSHVKNKFKRDDPSRLVRFSHYNTQSMDTLRSSREMNTYGGLELSAISNTSIDRVHTQSTRDRRPYYM
ncbi:neuronal membrane glycoprotein M6-b-like [Ptychodera flava]|uniref:neuronal membrane glycoprotein M6-b-like n=1 Tax=Ptychodera flava TaxID=63121 RepID=UPI003969CDA6